MDIDFSTSQTGTTAAPAAQAFGVVFSGFPVRTDFAPVDATGLKFACQLQSPGDLPSPLPTVSDMVLFLLPHVPLPPNHGVLCYWQLSLANAPAAGNELTCTGFELLGALTPDKPSSIFYTGWGENEQVIKLTSTGAPVMLTIGLSLEPLGNIGNILSTNNNSNSRQQNRLWVAQKIGADLFAFMQSFDTGAAGAGNMVVPTNIFDRWFRRFEARMQRNPNFFLKDNEQ